MGVWNDSLSSASQFTAVRGGNIGEGNMEQYIRWLALRLTNEISLHSRTHPLAVPLRVVVSERVSTVSRFPIDPLQSTNDW